MTDPDFKSLERKIDELIRLCDTLARENHALKAQQRTWMTERSQLVEKNELARGKVEAMILRLKSLEQDG